MYLKINFKKIFKNLFIFIKKIKKIKKDGFILKNINIWPTENESIYKSKWYYKLNNIYNYQKKFFIETHIIDPGMITNKKYEITFSIKVHFEKFIRITYENKDIELLERIIEAYVDLHLENVNELEILNFKIKKYSDFEKIKTKWLKDLTTNNEIIFKHNNKSLKLNDISILISLNNKIITKSIYKQIKI